MIPLAVVPRIVFRLNLQVCSSVASFTACEQRMRINSVMMSTMMEERRTMIALQSKREMNIHRLRVVTTNNHTDTSSLLRRAHTHMN